ncbi:hypothetical protein [Azospirillum largimobile]
MRGGGMGRVGVGCWLRYPHLASPAGRGKDCRRSSEQALSPLPRPAGEG